MILVNGKLTIKDERRDEFIERSISSVIAAREARGCLDFSVSPDPLEVNRVNISERWTTQEELDSFRDSGPDDDLFDVVESFDVKQWKVD